MKRREEEGTKNSNIKDLSSPNHLPKMDGSYRFCYRDYVNHEEILAMMCRRWTMERLLFRPQYATELCFSDQTKECILKERGKLFGVIPVSIDWTGRVVITKADTAATKVDGVAPQGATAVHWDTTRLKMGWTVSSKRLRFLNKVLGTTIDRPPAAEKLRVDPWYIKLAPDDYAHGDILCFMREGKGHLIFAKEECLKQIVY
jgi:hypothetical protein